MIIKCDYYSYHEELMQYSFNAAELYKQRDLDTT